MDELGQDQNQAAEGLDISPALSTALRKVLRPLVRLLLAKGVTYPYLLNLLKTIFVDVGSQEFSVKGKRPTDSRLSVLTGVHRKDVRRLAGQPPDAQAAPAHVSFGARLVARWCGDTNYLDENGVPLPLPRLASRDFFVSFERLVAEESKDIRARAVLDEMLRLGIVHLDDEDRVVLRSGAFVPERGAEEKLYYFGRNVHDHMAAATHNVLDGKPAMLERSVYSDGLDAAGVAELAALSERLGMEALHAINRRARELREQSAGATPSRRMTFGIYFFQEEPAPSSPPPLAESPVEGQ